MPSHESNLNIKCLGCAQPVLGPTVINRMQDGSSCRRCVERVLDAQPTLITDGVLEGANRVRAEGSEGEAPILYFPSPQTGWDEPEPA